MPKAYKVTRHKIKFDKNNIHDVFSVKPVNYGTLTTSQAADQIANESSLTPGDVLNVLNRYSHYVKQNLQKGYAIELLGFGKLDIKFIKTTTPDEKKATSALVKGMMPNFVGSLQSVSCSTRQLYLLSLFIDLSFLSADVRQMLYRKNHLFDICFICKRSF